MSICWYQLFLNVFEVYDTLLEEELTQKLSKVEAAGYGRQYGEAWNLVNEIKQAK